MLFNSWTFAVFLPLVFLLHHAGRRAAWQVGVLTVASFAFYGWERPSLLVLLVLSTAGSLLLVPDLHLADYSDTSAPRGSQQPA